MISDTAPPVSSVERGTSNKALEAYKRRGVHDPNKGVKAHNLDTGTMPGVEGSEAHKEAQARLKRDEKALKEGRASYLGEHFNAI